jgi:hypothetical protein
MPTSRPSLALALLLAACSGGDKAVAIINSPPSASIISPPDGSAADEGAIVAFEGRVNDDSDSDDELQVRWASDIDGELPGPFTVQDGFTLYETANLSSGNHIISLLVVDSRGESAQSSITFTVNDLPEAPEIAMIRPISGETGIEGEPFEFAAEVSDAQDEPEALRLSFTSDLSGEICAPTADGTGLATCEGTLGVGRHLLTYTVTDSGGDTASATGYFDVLARTAIDDDGDGFTEEQGDCDDGDASVNPQADEFFNSRDDDCDGLTDEGTEGYDDDGDGLSEVGGDCDDADATQYPGAAEACDGEDDDCDGIVDETTPCFDDDGDGWAETAGDCNDGSTSVYPGAPELADFVDNDCDGVADEGTVNYDDDGDGYAEISGDCNDSNAAISPAATERCGDGVDNNCNGSADEEGAALCTNYYYDFDGDAYGTTTGRCLCAPSGYYTSTYNTDCYDSNGSANPGASSWFTTSRGDGSYDYNCDSSQQKRYTDTLSCSGLTASGCYANQSGFRNSGSVPSCGSVGTWYTDCDWSWSSFSCSTPAGNSSRTQECR